MEQQQARLAAQAPPSEEQVALMVQSERALMGLQDELEALQEELQEQVGLGGQGTDMLCVVTLSQRRLC